MRLDPYDCGVVVVVMNRFATIFWHYYGGPLIGVRQRLWPEERRYGVAVKILALGLYLAQWVLLWWLPRPVQIGMLLILCSPQWLYSFTSLPHPVFEFRGYGMAAGVALIVGSLLAAYPIIALSVFAVWGGLSLFRVRILTSPLRFWQRAQEENHGS